jgi:hypothetical protein
LQYAKQVIELMAAHPGRPFKLIEIRRYVEISTNATDKQRRQAVRVGCHRVMNALIDTGAVKRSPNTTLGKYEWI